jgi:hypothetical protein
MSDLTGRVTGPVSGRQRRSAGAVGARGLRGDQPIIGSGLEGSCCGRPDQYSRRRRWRHGEVGRMQQRADRAAVVQIPVACGRRAVRIAGLIVGVAAADDRQRHRRLHLRFCGERERGKQRLEQKPKGHQPRHDGADHGTSQVSQNSAHRPFAGSGRVNDGSPVRRQTSFQGQNSNCFDGGDPVRIVSTLLAAGIRLFVLSRHVRGHLHGRGRGRAPGRRAPRA